MRKAEIIRQIIKESGCKKATVTQVVELTLAAIKEAIERHEPVQLRGFGSFKVVWRKGREIVHPTTQKKLRLPSGGVPRFEPYPKLKEAVLKAFEPKSVVSKKQDVENAEPEFNRDDALKSVEVCLSALRENPRDFRTRIRLGTVYESIGEHEKAAEEYRKILDIQPDNVEAHYNLGAVYWEMGRIDLAQEEFKRALELAPTSAEAHYNMGVALYKKGLYERAIPELEKAAEIDPESTKSYYYLGTCYSQLRRHDKAIKVFEQLLEIEPHNRSICWQLGLLYDKKGRPEEATEMYRKANIAAEEATPSEEKE